MVSSVALKDEGISLVDPSKSFRDGNSLPLRRALFPSTMPDRARALIAGVSDRNKDFMG
jgi:hypothetical protein